MYIQDSQAINRHMPAKTARNTPVGTCQATKRPSNTCDPKLEVETPSSESIGGNKVVQLGNSTHENLNTHPDLVTLRHPLKTICKPF